MIDAKKLELLQRINSDDDFICYEESEDDPGLIVEYEFNFEEMKTWLIACAKETPAPQIRVYNRNTGMYL